MRLFFNKKSIYGTALIAVVLAGAIQGLATTAQADIASTITPSAIDELDTARLVLRVDGASQPVELDRSPLEKAFEVLGVSTSTHFQSINGEEQRHVEYHIDLRPKRVGLLDIPPLRIGGEWSRPLQLKVNALSEEIREAVSSLVFFEVELSPNPVRVQAQTVLTRQLLYTSGVQPYGNLPAAPQLADALVVVLENDKTSNVLRNGRSYRMHEQRYAIFPEKSGPLSIAKASIMSAVRLRTRNAGRRSAVPVSTPEIILEVLPIPAEYPATKPWLPATEVSISEAWQPENPSFRVGEPLLRTIQIKVLGNRGSSVPPLNLDLPAQSFKQYPEPTRFEDDHSPSHLHGIRREAHSIIPIYPGEAVLPGLSLTWWDTVNERVEEAVLPQRLVRILGEPPASAPALQSEPTGTAPNSTEVEEMGGADWALRDYTAWLLALCSVGLIGWAAASMVRRANRRAQARAPKDDPFSTKAVRRSWKAFERACRSQDVKSQRDAWLNHLSVLWRTSVADTLARVKNSPDAKKLLDRLNQAVYGSAPTLAISGDELLHSTRRLIDEAQEAGSEDLLELNKSDHK